MFFSVWFFMAVKPLFPLHPCDLLKIEREEEKEENLNFTICPY